MAKKAAYAKVEGLLERVGLPREIFHRYPHELSGGQKQRVVIATALVLDPDLLILDEPTSALDAETEAEVLEALERLMAGRTTLVIAHRLSTVRRADRTAVLQEGRVVETGSPAELLAAGGAYHRLHALQTGTRGSVP